MLDRTQYTNSSRHPSEPGLIHHSHSPRQSYRSPQIHRVHVNNEERSYSDLLMGPQLRSRLGLPATVGTLERTIPSCKLKLIRIRQLSSIHCEFLGGGLTVSEYMGEQLVDALGRFVRALCAAEGSVFLRPLHLSSRTIVYLMISAGKNCNKNVHGSVPGRARRRLRSSCSQTLRHTASRRRSCFDRVAE